MSSRIEEPPDGLDAVDEDTLLRRLDEWSKNLHSLAKAVCQHKVVGIKDRRGHEVWPCVSCVKTVRHIVEYFFMAMHIKAKAVLEKAEKEGLELPLVNLHEAFFIASSMLDPATSVTLPEWGAA